MSGLPAPQPESTPPWPSAPAPLTMVPPGQRALQRGPLRAALALARPRQWIKNALVIAAAGAAGALGRDHVPIRVGLAAVAFCLLSAGVYAVNDVRDAAEDRLHPRKRRRPVAARELSPGAAVLLGLGWLAAGVALCAAVRPLLAAVGAGYALLSITYSWAWRRIPLLDLASIAGGFVLRALAGGVAAPVPLSRWFVLVVSCAALFLATGKRHAELMRRLGRGMGAVAPSVRGTLRHYTPARLRLLMAGSGGMALFAYYVWVFERADVGGIPWRILTAIPFTIGLLRYGTLVRAGAGEAPEETVLSDRTLLAAGIAWLVLFALSVHAGG